MSARWNSFKSYVISVPMGQEVEIQNPRLGLLHKIMILITIGLAVANMWYNGLWYRNYEAKALALEFWGSAPANPDVRPDYCQNASLQEFSFVYDPTYSYAPSVCADLPPGEMFTKDKSGMRFPTYTRDEYVWSTKGEDLCTQEEAACTSRGGTMSRSGDTCRCSLVEEFLAKNAEQSVFWLNHGYKVDMDEWGDSYQTQRSTEDHGWRHERGRQPRRTNSGGVMTVIQQEGDGRPCHINGRENWLGETVHGTVEEWLACGGLSLDERNAVLRGPESEPDGPAARISGVNLELHLTYSNYGNEFTYSNIRNMNHRGVLCTLVVKATPVWNSFTSISHTQMMPQTSREGGLSAYRYRYAQAVTINVEVSGMFGFLDWPLMFTSLMSSLVLLGIPKKIAKFVALFCVGATSKVYRNAQRTRFNIHDAVHGFSARLLGHSETYRALAGGVDDAGVSRPELEKRMVRVLGHRHQGEKDYLKLRSGSVPDVVDRSVTDFKEENFASLLSCLTDGHEQVSIEEFMHAASKNEILQVADVVTFFDLHRRRKFLERVFEASEVENYRLLAQKQYESAAASSAVEKKENFAVTVVSEAYTEACQEKEKSARPPGGGFMEKWDADNFANFLQKEVKAALAEALADGELIKGLLQPKLPQDLVAKESTRPTNPAQASPPTHTPLGLQCVSKGVTKIAAQAGCELPISMDCDMNPLDIKVPSQGYLTSEEARSRTYSRWVKLPRNKIPSGFHSGADSSPAYSDGTASPRRTGAAKVAPAGSEGSPECVGIMIENTPRACDQDDNRDNLYI